MEAIFRHGPPTVPEVQEAEPEPADRTGAAPDLPDLSEVHHAPKPVLRGKPHLAIPKEQMAQQQIVLTGASLKAFVATIPDEASICYIEVGEGKRPDLIELLAGVAIVGKK